MAGEGMNVRGPCSSCGAQLATDQRYCVECGQRVGPPMALPYAMPAGAMEAPAASRSGFVLPVPLQTISIFAALALGFGVVVGTAISPNLGGIIAAPSPTVVAEAPPPATTPTPATGGGGGGGSAGLSSTSPSSGTFASSTPNSSGGGSGGGAGGGNKKKQKKKKQQPQTFSGTVVRVNQVAQSYTLASGAGLVSIHATSLPQVGDQVQSPVRRLKNVTYAEQGARTAAGGATDQASFSGTVTYCADLETRSNPCSSTPPAGPDHFVYAVSSLGASVLVSSPPGAPLPPVGSQVQVAVHIGAPFVPVAPIPDTDFRPYPAPCNPSGSEHDGVPAQDPKTQELTQTTLTVNPQQPNALVEAVVQQTSCSDGLVLSADDIRSGGRDLAPLPLPAGIDPAKLTRGQAVQVAVDIAPDGTLTLKGIASDQGTSGADDAASGQGTLAGS
jgi:hypothetical protein